MTCHLTLPYAQEARILAHALCEDYAVPLFRIELPRAVALQAFWQDSPVVYPSRRAMIEALWGGDR